MTKIYDVRVDGDVLIYRAGFSADSRSDKKTHSFYNAKLIIGLLQEKFPGNITIYLSSLKKADNFRHTVSKDYKANRKIKCRNKSCTAKLRKLEDIQQSDERFFRAYQCDDCQAVVRDSKCVWHNEIREFLIKRYETIECSWGEADDWLGVNMEENTVICSIDKDLLMLPGLHYRMTSEKLLESSDPGQLWLSECKKKILGTGFKWFCTQMLMGDSIDNIPKPTKGFGPVAAFNLMNPNQTVTDMWNTVVSHYKTAGKTTDDILSNAKLLWISRAEKQIFDISLVADLIAKIDYPEFKPIEENELTDDHELILKEGNQDAKE